MQSNSDVNTKLPKDVEALAEKESHSEKKSTEKVSKDKKDQKTNLAQKPSDD